MGGGGDAGLRVFVSHTSELRRFPRKGSYIAAVERAVSACGHVVVNMADFAAGDLPPAELCVERVRSSEVYVGVLGTRYGSPVPERPELSYTELEFEAATKAGLTRLVFLLDKEAEDSGIPVAALVDSEFGGRQEEFRRRVCNGGLVTQSFGDPAVLGQLVERSLRELSGHGRGRGRCWDGAGPGGTAGGGGDGSGGRVRGGEAGRVHRPGVAGGRGGPVHGDQPVRVRVHRGGRWAGQDGVRGVAGEDPRVPVAFLPPLGRYVGARRAGEPGGAADHPVRSGRLGTGRAAAAVGPGTGRLRVAAGRCREQGRAPGAGAGGRWHG